MDNIKQAAQQIEAKLKAINNNPNPSVGELQEGTRLFNQLHTINQYILDELKNRI